VGVIFSVCAKACVVSEQPSKLSMLVKDSYINVIKVNGEDYICLTDMAKSAGAERALHSWLRSKNTVDFLGFWEQLNNADFKLHEFVYFKNNAGSNSFNPSVSEWITKTNSKGIITKQGRYGGTYAHKDIAFEFGTWLSPEFKLLIIKEFQRLKAKEQQIIEWDSRRYLSRMNYKLHTDTIKNVLLPTLNVSGGGQVLVYASEADMLNDIVFGQSASQWKRENPDKAKSSANQRDSASIIQLVVLANLESLNSHLMAQNTPQRERWDLLRQEAVRQYTALIKKDEPSGFLEGSTGGESASA